MGPPPSPWDVGPLDEEELTVRLLLCRARKTRAALEGDPSLFITLIRIIEEVTGHVADLAPVIQHAELDEEDVLSLNSLFNDAFYIASSLVFCEPLSTTGQPELRAALKTTSYDLLNVVLSLAPLKSIPSLEDDLFFDTISTLSEDVSHLASQSGQTARPSQKLLKIKARLDESTRQFLDISLRREGEGRANKLFHSLISGNFLFSMQAVSVLSIVGVTLSLVSPQSFTLATEVSDIPTINGNGERRHDTELLVAFLLKTLYEAPVDNHLLWITCTKCTGTLCNLLRYKDGENIAGILTLFSKTLPVIAHCCVNPEGNVAAAGLEVLNVLNKLDASIIRDRRINNPMILSEIIFRPFSIDRPEYEVSLMRLLVGQMMVVISNERRGGNMETTTRKTIATSQLNSIQWTSSYLQYPDVLKGIVFRMASCSETLSLSITCGYLLALVLPACYSPSYMALLSSILGSQLPPSFTNGNGSETSPNNCLDFVGNIALQLSQFPEEILGDSTTLSTLPLQELMEICFNAKDMGEGELKRILINIKTRVENRLIGYDKSGPFGDEVEKLCSEHIQTMKKDIGKTDHELGIWSQSLKIFVSEVISGNVKAGCSAASVYSRGGTVWNQDFDRMNFHGNRSPFNQDNAFNSPFGNRGKDGPSSILDFLDRVIKEREIPEMTERRDNSDKDDDDEQDGREGWVLREYMDSYSHYRSGTRYSLMTRGGNQNSSSYYNSFASVPESTFGTDTTNVQIPFDVKSLQVIWLLSVVLNVINSIQSSNYIGERGERIMMGNNMSMARIEGVRRSKHERSTSANGARDLNVSYTSPLSSAASEHYMFNRDIRMKQGDIDFNTYYASNSKILESTRPKSVNNRQRTTRENMTGKDQSSSVYENALKERTKRCKNEKNGDGSRNEKKGETKDISLLSLYVSPEDILLSCKGSIENKSQKQSPVEFLLQKITSIKRQLVNKHTGQNVAEKCEELAKELDEMITNLETPVQLFVFYTCTIQRPESMYRASTKWDIEKLYNEYIKSKIISDQVLLLERTNCIPLNSIISNNLVPEFTSLLSVKMERKWSYLKNEMMAKENDSPVFSDEKEKGNEDKLEETRKSGDEEYNKSSDNTTRENESPQSPIITLKQDEVDNRVNDTIINETKQEEPFKDNNAETKPIKAAFGITLSLDADLGKDNEEDEIKMDEDSSLHSNKELDIEAGSERTKQIGQVQQPDNQDLGTSTNESRPSNKEISLIEYDGFAAPKEMDAVPSSVLVPPTVSKVEDIPPQIQSTTTIITTGGEKVDNTEQIEGNDEINTTTSSNNNNNTNTPEKKQESPVTPTRKSLSLALMSGLTVKEKLEALRQMRRQGK